MTANPLPLASEFRFARVSDLAELAAWIPSVEHCEQWAGARVEFPIRVERLADEIEFSIAESWCLLEGSELVAFGQIVPKSGGRQHLARLIVSPAFRGKGIGRLLTKGLVERARAKTPRCVSLNVSHDNLAALNLYRSLGFRDAERPEQELASTSQYMVLELDPD